jgi:hypothetical protein
MPGSTTSEAEVTNISRHGFWLLVDGQELFLPFAEFPSRTAMGASVHSWAEDRKVANARCATAVR